MSDQRPEPQSTVQAASRVVEGVVTGLITQPLLLAIVVLNIAGIGAAIWFLSALVEMNSERMMFLLKSCIPIKGAI